MSGILGKKVGMTRLIQDDGRVIPITVVQCEPNEVAQVKTTEKDGYPAVVLGFSKLKKPTKTKQFRYMKEFRIEEDEQEAYKKGEQVTLEKLQEVEAVKVTATSKGKGFAGVIKRHNFSRGPETHGSHHHRRPGSIGACTKPGRVAKGKKLPGRMGNARVTRGKVKVAYINPEKNIIGLKGAVPGPNGGLVIISTK
ncbi:50S ribosomal protein L3 [Candidatus Peregrinibacteria bacterium]|jgi:large subunit ribosomal protein L3|nr:50S ribosomal protein L3 [Candidatus Peregrinibacteria bacterium]